MIKRSILMFLFFIFMTAGAWAEDASSNDDEVLILKEQMQKLQNQFQQIQDQYGVTINNLQARIDQVEKDKSVPVANAQSRSSVGKWAPEMGVIADTLFTLNSPKADGDGADVLNLRELELVLGSSVDPYSRLDATIAFSTSEDEPVALEEAYLTRFGLPLDSTARIGKFKPKMGKALGVHRDSLDTIDEPLVIQKYFGDEGMSKTGVDISRILGLPIPVTQQLTVGILDGGNAEDVGVFGETKRRPTLYGHLKNYIDVTDVTGLELGGSYMTGSRDEDSSFEVQIFAADATLTHQFNARQNMKIQGEVFNVDRKESMVVTDEDDGLGGTIPVQHDLDGNIWGAYGLIDFRVHPMWSVGGRYDTVEPIAVDLPAAGARKDDRAYSGYLTFYQSEFARWRTQFTHTDFSTGKDDNAVYIQGTFAIGEHKHKIQ